MIVPTPLSKVTKSSARTHSYEYRILYHVRTCIQRYRRVTRNRDDTGPGPISYFTKGVIHTNSSIVVAEFLISTEISGWVSCEALYYETAGTVFFVVPV